MSKMRTEIKAETMIEYLQWMLDRYIEERDRFGNEDRMVRKYMDEAIACKCMVENLIGMPVNLRKDGKVTVGF